MEFVGDTAILCAVIISIACIVIQLCLDVLVFLINKIKGYAPLGNARDGFGPITIFFALWLTAAYAVLGYGLDKALTDSLKIPQDVRQTWVVLAVVNLWAAHLSMMIYNSKTHKETKSNQSCTGMLGDYARGISHALVYGVGSAVIAFASTVSKVSDTVPFAYTGLALVVVGFLFVYITMTCDGSDVEMIWVGYVSIITGLLLFVAGWVLLCICILVETA